MHSHSFQFVLKVKMFWKFIYVLSNFRRFSLNYYRILFDEVCFYEELGLDLLMAARVVRLCLLLTFFPLAIEV